MCSDAHKIHQQMDECQYTVSLSHSSAYKCFILTGRQSSGINGRRNKAGVSKGNVAAWLQMLLTVKSFYLDKGVKTSESSSIVFKAPSKYRNPVFQILRQIFFSTSKFLSLVFHKVVNFVPTCFMLGCNFELPVSWPVLTLMCQDDKDFITLHWTRLQCWSQGQCYINKENE